MTATLLNDISLWALLVRMLTTAAIVMAVTWAVGAFGPIVGGAIAGLPITLGPGFFFLVPTTPVPFIAKAASWSLLSLCATQLFLLAYIASARNRSPWLPLLLAILTWCAVALVVRTLSPSVGLGAAAFAATTWACWRLGAHFSSSDSAPPGQAGLMLLVLRGILAGVLVAVVTTAAHLLGPAGSGILLTYPIGYTVIAFTVHQRFGRKTATTMLHSAVVGTISLAVFCASLALLGTHIPAWTAFAGALAASMLYTTMLVIRRS